MDYSTYPTNVQATVSFFPQLGRENRLSDLGLDQKLNFFKQLHGINKNTPPPQHTAQQLDRECCHEPQTWFYFLCTLYHTGGQRIQS
jgi:hypothetical protein